MTFVLFQFSKGCKCQINEFSFSSLKLRFVAFADVSQCCRSAYPHHGPMPCSVQSRSNKISNVFWTWQLLSVRLSSCGLLFLPILRSAPQYTPSLHKLILLPQPNPMWTFPISWFPPPHSNPRAVFSISPPLGAFRMKPNPRYMCPNVIV